MQNNKLLREFEYFKRIDPSLMERRMRLLETFKKAGILTFGQLSEFIATPAVQEIFHQNNPNATSALIAIENTKKLLTGKKPPRTTELSIYTAAKAHLDNNLITEDDINAHRQTAVKNLPFPENPCFKSDKGQVLLKLLTDKGITTREILERELANFLTSIGNPIKGWENFSTKVRDVLYFKRNPSAFRMMNEYISTLTQDESLLLDLPAAVKPARPKKKRKSRKKSTQPT